MSALGPEIDRVHLGLTPRMARWGAASLVAAIVGTALGNHRLAVGLAVGGGITLALFQLHRVLVPAMLSSPTQPAWRALFWAVWALKLPLIGMVLYIAFRTDLADPVGVALGAGILPVIATVIAVRAALRDALRRAPGVQAP